MEAERWQERTQSTYPPSSPARAGVVRYGSQAQSNPGEIWTSHKENSAQQVYGIIMKPDFAVSVVDHLLFSCALLLWTELYPPKIHMLKP